MLPLVTLEEHFVSDNLRDSQYAAMLGLDLFPPEVSRKLLSLQTERIEDMDEAGIAMQVVSHNPGAGALPLHMCRAANDQLFADGTSRTNGRLAGFAALPMSSPLQAAEELSRCVHDLGFVGALISNHAEGHFFDDPSYWPVFEKAQSLDVPIYLHPTFPDQAQGSRFWGNFSKAAAEAMSAYAWGWHSDVGLHFVRLFASGLFDEYPRLKLILGHMGEMTPFMIERIQRFCPRWGQRRRSLSTVWAENVWFTTSGMFTLGPLACLLHTTTVDKIMFSVDYPFEKNGDGRRFIEDVQKSGLLTPEEVEMVAFRNAESLLRVKVVGSG
jgi:predicted TIM-barrel fold metal-dependent hydrolase